jgi:hypothetical protein
MSKLRNAPGRDIIAPTASLAVSDGRPAVRSLRIGAGYQLAPKVGRTGTVYIDDIGFGRSVAP